MSGGYLLVVLPGQLEQSPHNWSKGDGGTKEDGPSCEMAPNSQRPASVAWLEFLVKLCSLTASHGPAVASAKIIRILGSVIVSPFLLRTQGISSCLASIHWPKRRSGPRTFVSVPSQSPVRLRFELPKDFRSPCGCGSK